MKNCKLTDTLDSKHIFLDIDAENREDLIRKVSVLLAETNGVSDSRLLAEDAIRRETEMPTGIERGIALPHARTTAVKGMTVAFARPLKPLDFNAPDNQPADLVFFSAIPPKAINEYLKLTAQLVRLLASNEVLDKLRKAKDAAQVREALGLD